MRRICLFIFICSFILLRPYIIQNGGFWYYGDDQDYFAHSASIVFGQFPSYKKEYLVIDKDYPQGSIGCSLLALPFVGSFSLIDRLSNSNIVQQRTPENIPRSWTQFGFLFAACFYFSLGCFLLYRGALYCVEERYAFLSVVFTVMAQGIPLYAYRRPMFSPYGEFFLQSLCVFIFLKNLNSAKKFPDLTWHYLVLGIISALIFLTRYNNIALALAWSLVFVLMKEHPIKLFNQWKEALLWAFSFLGMVVIFKIWPEAYNQHHPYPWIMHYLVRNISFPDFIHRTGHILFGLDWGLIYTAPYLLLGLFSAFYLKYPAKKYLLGIIATLVVNLYIVFVWGDQGSWHGYRYLIACATPLLVLPVAFLIKHVEQLKGKKLTLVWTLLAIPPALSMVCFEANHSTFNLYLAPVDLGEKDFTNYLYQFHVWGVVLFKPMQFLSFLCMGGVEYFQYLLTHALKDLGLFANSYFRNYTIFDGWTLVKILLIYSIPFSLRWFFKEPANGHLEKNVPHYRSRIISCLLFVLWAYGSIFLLFVINLPCAERIKEPPEAIYNVLNHGLLHQDDYKYLLEMERRGIYPNKTALREFKDYFQLVVDTFPGQSDSYSMLGYCQYYLGHKNEAIKDYTSSCQSNPVFFGNYYNLAVIYFNKGEFLQSAKLIQQALSLPLQSTAQSLLSSNRVYILILEQLPGQFPENIAQYLSEEKQKAMELLRLDMENLNKPASPSNQKILLQLI